jgi:hypothetical protein
MVSESSICNTTPTIMWTVRSVEQIRKRYQKVLVML